MGGQFHLKKPISYILACVLFIYMSSALFPASRGLSATSHILIDTSSGRVLLEGNSHAKMLIASTTKIMTALIVSEKCGLDEQVIIKPEYAKVEGSSMYLKEGEELTIRALLYGLLLSSGNDAAVALACYTAGSVEDFAGLMNEKAAQLELKDTHFTNPHGLDDEEHYSSAYDLAKIAAEFMRNKDLSEISATRKITIAGRVLTNHNKMLSQYSGAIGIKTGYTESAGRSLISCAERDGVKLICVTLNDPNDWADHTTLLDFGFSNYYPKTITDCTTDYSVVPVISGLTDSIAVRPSRQISVLVSDKDNIELNVILPKFVYAPVASGDQLGEIEVKLNGETIATVPLVAAGEAKQDPSLPLTFWEKLMRGFHIANKYGISRSGIYYIY